MVLDILPLVISANSSQCLNVVARSNYLLYSHLMSRWRALLSPSATVLEATQVYSPAEARLTSCVVDIVDIIVDIVGIIVDIADINVDTLDIIVDIVCVIVDIVDIIVDMVVIL